jgi:hypothetical protein
MLTDARPAVFKTIGWSSQVGQAKCCERPSHNPCPSRSAPTGERDQSDHQPDQ